MSSSRHGAPLIWYSESPARKSVRVIVTSLNSIGSRPAVLSMHSDTSARPSAGRSGVPAKMTSSILPPRSVRGPWAPSTQATASTRFDFPEPLGPTTTVTPGSNSRTVLSANDLKPRSVSDLRNTWAAPARVRGRVPGATGGGLRGIVASALRTGRGITGTRGSPASGIVRPRYVDPEGRCRTRRARSNPGTTVRRSTARPRGSGPIADRSGRLHAQHPDRSPCATATGPSPTARSTPPPTASPTGSSALGHDEHPLVVVAPLDHRLDAAPLGALKAGRLVVPLDPRWPTRAVARGRPAAPAGVLVVPDDGVRVRPCPDTIAGPRRSSPPISCRRPGRPDPGIVVDPDAPAFVFFTSGSTGAPEGHRARAPHADSAIQLLRHDVPTTAWRWSRRSASSPARSPRSWCS